jgi:hypothetical protein
MRETANPTSPRIGQLFRMLSSDQPAEAGGVGLHAAQLVCDGCKCGGRSPSRRYFEATL